jgi:Uma2 family endonuclease
MQQRRKLPKFMTAEEFLVWPGDGAGTKYQLIDGELRAMAPASAVHGMIQANMARLLGNHLRGAGIRCQTVTEPAIHVRSRARINTRIPDLGVSCAPVTASDIALPEPILLVEILSAGNKSQTWDNVWAYCTIPSIREILVLSSFAIEADLLRRGQDGHWPPDPIRIEDGGALVLESIGLTLALRAVYEGTYLVGGQANVGK